MCQDNEKNESFTEKENDLGEEKIPTSAEIVEQESRYSGMESSKSKGSFASVLICGFLIVSTFLGYKISRAESVGSNEVGKSTEQTGFSEILRGVQQYSKPGVAIVRLYGVIQTASDQNILGRDKGADSTVAQLKKLGKNKNVKAIVLRINSPGGTVGASQEIHAELVKLKKKGIKIVASMADVCASGGVYAAVAADKVLANKGTITGSVGVIFSVSNFKQLMDKVGMRAYSIRSGKFKDIGSYSRDMTEEERVLLQNIVDSTYEQFLDAVVEGRGLKEEDVRLWADGRIFNGEQALEHKLIDRLGTFEDAVDLAHELAGIDERNIIRTKVNPFDKFEAMFGSLWGGAFDKVVNQIPMTHSPLLYYYPGWQ